MVRDLLYAALAHAVAAREIRQGGVTVLARLGDEGDNFLDPFGGQEPLQTRGVARLSAGLAFGLFLDDRFGGSERIGRGRGRGIGGIATQQRLQLPDLFLQRGQRHALLGQAGIARKTAATQRGFHDLMLKKDIAYSCANSPKLRCTVAIFLPGEEVMNHFDRTEQLGRLVQALRQANPRNNELAAFAREIGYP